MPVGGRCSCFHAWCGYRDRVTAWALQKSIWWAVANDDGDALLDVSHALEAMGDRIAAADAAAHASLAFQRHNRRGSALSASGRATRIITDCGATTPATRAAATSLPLTGP
jgi:hypothetical protein